MFPALELTTTTTKGLFHLQKPSFFKKKLRNNLHVPNCVLNTRGIYIYIYERCAGGGGEAEWTGSVDKGGEGLSGWDKLLRWHNTRNMEEDMKGRLKDPPSTR